MDKQDINKRFICAIDSLIAKNGLTKISIAQGLEIKPSKFSEILNGRMNVGTDTLALLCENYNYSASWLLLGKGSPTQEPQSKDSPITVNDVHKMFTEIMRDKDIKFKEQAEEIGALKEIIRQLKREKGKDVLDVPISGTVNVG